MKEKIEKYKDYLVDWLRNWFEINGKDCKAVIGISGGKDSSCVAALCVEALGKDSVIGVLMPNGVQSDINDSYLICETLGIKSVYANINIAYNHIVDSISENGIEVSRQTQLNLPPRLRMVTLYAVSQSVGGRVVGTSNLDETMLGWCTRFGDNVCDVEPIMKMHANEVVELGIALGVPEKFMRKPASDGLTNATDEKNFGFLYTEFQDFYEEHNGRLWAVSDDELDGKQKKMMGMYRKSEFKRKPIPEPEMSCFAFCYEPKFSNGDEIVSIHSESIRYKVVDETVCNNGEHEYVTELYVNGDYDRDGQRYMACRTVDKNFRKINEN